MSRIPDSINEEALVETDMVPDLAQKSTPILSCENEAQGKQLFFDGLAWVKKLMTTVSIV